MLFNGPSGIVLSSDEAFALITDFGGCRICKSVTSTSVVTTVEGSGSAEHVIGVGTLAGFAEPVSVYLSGVDSFA